MAATDPERTYHHGNLRAALLDAAAEELAVSGIEAFSLRRVAQRAGVSHAAPSHHFADRAGLLKALAARAFGLFVDTQKARQAQAAPDAVSQLQAAGLGYADFARAHPHLFQLIFASTQFDHDTGELASASEAAFEYLVKGVEAVTGRNAWTDADAMIDVAATWSIAHGVADLLRAGRLKAFQGLPSDQRDAAIVRIISRALPSPLDPD